MITYDDDNYDDNDGGGDNFHCVLADSQVSTMISQPTYLPLY